MTDPPRDIVWPAAPQVPRLRPGEVHVWTSPLSPDPRRRQALAPLLSDSETARADRFHFAADAHRYVIARGLLRKLLAGYCDTPPERIALRESDHGRPQLADAHAHRGVDGPPATVFDFNLSHARDRVVYAFSAGARVGVDVEWVAPLDEMDELVTIHFSAREQATWKALPADVRERAFYDCWTRKEAFVKAIGEGLSHPLDSFDVRFAPGDEPAIERLEGGDPARWSLRALAPEAGYASALAVEAPGITLRCWSIPD